MSTASQPASSSSASLAYPPASISGSTKTNRGDLAILTYDELSESDAIRFVSDPGAGATVLFSGTTRDSFKGKAVTKLEYESYTPLALKTLSSLLESAHTSAPFADNPIPISSNANPSEQAKEDRVERCYIAHRLGEVAVGECSILIAVSSAHRKEAFVAAEWLLEEVKKNVAVWKREFYATGEKVTARDGKGEEIDPTKEVKEAEEGEHRKGDEQEWSWKANFPTS